MKKGIVVFGSHYGATEAYARETAKRLGFDCKSYKEVSKLNDYQVVVIGGGHYAGGITGLKDTIEKVDTNKTLVYIYSVGLSNRTEENLKAIREAIRKVVPVEKADDSRIYYYRGNMDLNKLGFMHRNMMKMMIKMTKKIPENERTDDNRGVIELSEKSVDFIQVNDVEDMVQQINQQMEKK